VSRMERSGEDLFYNTRPGEERIQFVNAWAVVCGTAFGTFIFKVTVTGTVNGQSVVFW
jgi:hypothetical protein